MSYFSSWSWLVEYTSPPDEVLMKIARIEEEMTWEEKIKNAA